MKSHFFNLLRFSLSEDFHFSSVLTAEEWAEVYVIAQQQTLGGVLFAGLERLSAEQRPPRSILLKWFAMTERIKQANRLLNKRAVEASEYFFKEGFSNCILKGQGVAAYYPNPLLRMSGDVDIWLSGGHECIHNFARERVGLQGITYHHVHYPLFDDVEIEVHITPGYLSNPWLNNKLQRYFKDSFSEQASNYVTLPDAVGSIPRPKVEFDLVFLLLHMYKHLIGQGIGLRQMMDYYYVLQQPIDDGVRGRVVARLKEFKVLRFAHATMFVMSEVFGLEEKYLLVGPDEKAGRFLLDEIMQAGNFGKYDARLERRHNETAWFRLVRSLKRNVRFLRYYPNEVFWNPIFRTWQYIWRLRKKTSA